MMTVTEYLINNTNKTGIDLDSVSEFTFLKAYFNAKHMFPDKEIKVFMSSGGDGYHIEIVGVKSRLSVRRTLGDCKGRMNYSEIRSLLNGNKEEFAVGDPIVDDVLFTFKTKVVEMGELRRVYRQQRVPIDEGNILAKPFW